MILDYSNILIDIEFFSEKIFLAVFRKKKLSCLYRIADVCPRHTVFQPFLFKGPDLILWPPQVSLRGIQAKWSIPHFIPTQNMRFEAKLIFWRRIPLISCGTTPFFKGSHPLEPGRKKAKQGLIFAEQSSLFFSAGRASLIYTSENDVQLSNTKDPPLPPGSHFLV